MPPQIGDYISAEIYGGKLNSNPKHCVPRTTPSCFFIDIPEGKEQKDGKSWVVSYIYDLTDVYISKAVAFF